LGQLKNQNDIILVKKIKVNELQPGHWVNLPGQSGHTEFFLPLFFLQSGPVPAPGQPVGPARSRVNPLG